VQLQRVQVLHRRNVEREHVERLDQMPLELHAAKKWRISRLAMHRAAL
jgi:hypothetical protein